MYIFNIKREYKVFSSLIFVFYLEAARKSMKEKNNYFQFSTSWTTISTPKIRIWNSIVHDCVLPFQSLVWLYLMEGWEVKTSAPSWGQLYQLRINKRSGVQCWCSCTTKLAQRTAVVRWPWVDTPVRRISSTACNTMLRSYFETFRSSRIVRRLWQSKVVVEEKNPKVDETTYTICIQDILSWRDKRSSLLGLIVTYIALW